MAEDKQDMLSSLALGLERPSLKSKSDTSIHYSEQQVEFNAPLNTQQDISLRSLSR